MSKPSIDLKQLVSDIGEYMGHPFNVITSEDDLNESNPVNPETKDSSLTPKNVSLPTETNDDTQKDTDWSDGVEPKVFNKEVVLRILDILRDNGFKDAVFDKKRGFVWNYFPAATYVTISFDDKYNKNKSFYINLLNRFIIDEPMLREVDTLKEKFDAFEREVDFCKNILSQVSEIYPIVY